jgi:hypothetical protein
LLSRRLSVVAVVAVFSSAQADTIYVDDDAPPGGDGQSWDTAYRFLQDAAAEAAGDPNITEIRVAQGTYTPDRDEASPDPPSDSDCCTSHYPDPGCDDPDCEAAVCAIDAFCCEQYWDSGCAELAMDVCDIGCPNREATFLLLNGVSIMGGYAGLGGANPDEWDVALYETILSGDLLGNDLWDWCDPSHDENSYTVVAGSDTDETAVLDGFTVTAGKADGPYGGPDPWRRGGGMYSEAGSPTVTNCMFNDNYAEHHGGGMWNANSSPTVTNCTFGGNTAEGWSGIGGGMFNYESSPTVTDCTFSGNYGGYWGGGMGNHESSPTVTDCTFSENSGYRGGGMYNWYGNPTVTNCTFSWNECWVDGGGMYNENSNPTVTGCTFSDNAALVWGGMVNEYSNATVTDCTFSGNYGGGMDNYQSSTTVVNCTFSGNSGSGMANGGGSPTVTNCTFSGNEAGVIGGGIFGGGTVTNCILWGNAPNEISGSAAVTYSNVRDGWPGPGNIDVDPLFVDELGPDGTPGTGDEDLRLAADSWCIDAGDSAAVPPGVTTDLEGNPRFVDAVNYPEIGNPDGANPVVDMGAFEAAADTVASPRAYVLWRHGMSGDNSIWMTNWAAILSASVQPISNTNWTVVGMGDFDGDGEPYDILWRQQVTGKNSMWLMDGTSILPGSGPVQPVANTNWVVAGTRDFDGDGRCDILWHYQVTGDNLMWLMDGTTILPGTGPVRSFADPNWTVVATSD